ncbi:MAG: TraR/DksA C4-type zinc finger protein [Phycisphaerae bacterium]|nr:TraR/DksA C4-type zinc finger protein [Phycisphaerae bacterium]
MPKRKRRLRRKTTLSKAELHHFRELLIIKLKEIIGDVDHIESEALKKSRLDASGDLSSMPIHMADIGSDNYEQEFALGLMDSERKLVHEIYAALKRIEDGTYGICEGTGEPIPKARLEGIPWARHCVQYAEKLEKGLVNEEDRWYDYEDEEENADFDDENKDDGEEHDDDDDIFFYGYDDDDDEEDLV